MFEFVKAFRELGIGKNIWKSVDMSWVIYWVLKNEERWLKKYYSLLISFFSVFMGDYRKNSDAFYLYICIYLCHVGVTWGLHMNMVKWFLYIELVFQYVFPALLTMPKPFNSEDHNKLRKILKEMGIPDHMTCLLRNLYAGQEATVRTGHGTTDQFQIKKGVCQGCILSPCLFNLYVEYIMRNARLDEAQGRIKIAGRNINNLRYADDTTLMAES